MTGSREGAGREQSAGLPSIVLAGQLKEYLSIAMITFKGYVLHLSSGQGWLAEFLATVPDHANHMHPPHGPHLGSGWVGVSCLQLANCSIHPERMLRVLA